MISFEEAYEKVKNEFSDLKNREEVVSLENSIGRITSQAVYTSIDLPSFDNSAMDGFAVKYAEGVKEWILKGEITAGNFHEITMNQDEAVSIMTGARIPEGCDTVIPVEKIETNGTSVKLKMDCTYKKGENIRLQGQDLKKNEILVNKNVLIKPKHIAALASCGISEISVFKKLKAAVFATGDELIEIRRPLAGDAVYASNLYSVKAFAKETGFNVLNLGVIKDSKEGLYETVQEALQNDADIVISTGGVSMGNHDYLQEVYRSLGAEIIFWKVNIKPGKPMLFAKLNYDGRKILVFGLPGNPVSSFINYKLFVDHAFNSVYCSEEPMLYNAELTSLVKKKDDKKHFVRGSLTYNKITYKNEFKPLGNQSSSNITGLASSNSIGMISENVQDPEIGTEILCMNL